MFLGDDEMVVLTRAGLDFTNFAGTRLERRTQRVLWDPIQAEKAGFKHFMLKEIFEQPQSVRDTVLGRVSGESGRVFLEEMTIPEAELAEVENVSIIACGTSWHAGLRRTRSSRSPACRLKPTTARLRYQPDHRLEDVAVYPPGDR